MKIKNIAIYLLILYLILVPSMAHTLNINIKCKTFEIKTLYNNNNIMIDQYYQLSYLNNLNIYEKYFFGKTNIYGSLFFDLYPEIYTYKINISDGEHSIDRIINLENQLYLNKNEGTIFFIVEKILFGLNWIIGISGLLLYIYSNKYKQTNL